MEKKVSYKAESISEYIDILNSIKKEFSKSEIEKHKKEEISKIKNELKLKGDNFFNSDKDFEMYYRGEPKDYGNTSGTPGIARGNWLSDKNESELMRECERRLPNEFAECKSTFERLVKMQHYGIPTRLLDITLDPLVALFFALYKDPKNHDDLSNEDAVVLVYKVPKGKICNYRSDKVSVVSNISVYNYDDLQICDIMTEIMSKYSQYKGLPKKFLEPAINSVLELGLDMFDDNVIGKFNKNKSIKHLLHEIKSEKPHFSDNINPNHLYRVFAVHPLLDNPRIRAQQGAFLLYGLKENRNQLAELKNSEIYLEKIIIPCAQKEAMLKDLILLGKTVDNIYPDWDGVSDFFRSFYKKNDFQKYY
ncbi:MAG: FRG domain-containing protein [Paludibacteraceae bacterium]|nr:FRG domain-containing protein [Paludibacteraceae bacterium]